MLALCGPTGAGKTTLLRALLGLEPSAQGDVRVQDRLLTPEQVGPAWRPFAWVPQDAPVVSGTLEDNFGLTGVSCPRALAELDALGAGELRAQLSAVKLGQGGRPLSGGERRWIALARAVATGYPVLLLDEPTAGLDPDARARVLELLRAARKSRALLVVSHAEEVIALADEVVRIGERY
ncbi:MAG: ATP-binding cassette domain-containing protein [Polyangiaceae bacterium]|nr:ATP-binding cassette domain-containing protein [Polyangiaceae bacterium]